MTTTNDAPSFRTRTLAWRSSPVVRLIVGAIVSVVFLALALRAVPVEQVWATLKEASLLFVGLTLLSIAVNTLAKAVRWNVLLGAEGQHIGLLPVLSALLIGQMLNTFIPTRIGDLSRAFTIGRRGPGTAFVLGTVVLEKLIEMVAFGLIVLTALLVLPLPAWAMTAAYQVVGVAVIVVGVSSVLAWRSPTRWLGRLAQRFNRGIVGRIVAGARAAVQSSQVFRRRSDVAKLIVLTLVVWATAIINNYLMLLAFGLVLPLGASVLLLVALQIGISLPSLPGTIGVFEYVCVLVLALYGVDHTLALSFGILLHAVVMLPPTLIALCLFTFARSDERSPLRSGQVHERS